MSNPKRQFSWTWLLSFLFGGSLLGGAGGLVWQDATDAARQEQNTKLISDHAVWLKRHDLEIKELQINEKGRDVSLSSIAKSLDEMSKDLRDLRRELSK